LRLLFSYFGCDLFSTISSSRSFSERRSVRFFCDILWFGLLGVATSPFIRKAAEDFFSLLVFNSNSPAPYGASVLFSSLRFWKALSFGGWRNFVPAGSFCLCSLRRPGLPPLCYDFFLPADHCGQVLCANSLPLLQWNSPVLGMELFFFLPP